MHPRQVCERNRSPYMKQGVKILSICFVKRSLYHIRMSSKLCSMMLEPNRMPKVKGSEQTSYMYINNRANTGNTMARSDSRVLQTKPYLKGCDTSLGIFLYLQLLRHTFACVVCWFELKYRIG